MSAIPLPGSIPQIYPVTVEALEGLNMSSPEGSGLKKQPMKSATGMLKSISVFFGALTDPDQNVKTDAP